MAKTQVTVSPSLKVILADGTTVPYAEYRMHPEPCLLRLALQMASKWPNEEYEAELRADLIDAWQKQWSEAPAATVAGRRAA